MPVDISLDQFWPIGQYNRNFCVEGFKFMVIMTQLRHMVSAMPSDKP